MKRLRILFLFIWALTLLSASSSYSSSVSEIIGASVESTIPPTPPCETPGFSVEQTVTLPATFDQGRFLRINKVNATMGGNGFAIVDGGGAYTKIIVFRLSDLSIVATNTVQTGLGKYRLPGRYQGDIGPDGFLFLFQEARNGGGFCSGGIGFNCISLGRYSNSTGLLLGETILAADTTANIDDAKLSNNSTILMVNAAPSGNREFRTFSIPSTTFLSLGTLTGVSAFGAVSNSLNNNNFIGLATAATPNVWRVPSGTALADATSSFSASFGGDLLSAIYAASVGGNDFILGESDTTSGAQAERGYIQVSSMVNNATFLYNAGGTDGSATFQSTFFDTVNNKIYTNRFNSGSGAFQFIRSQPSAGGIIEERFNCPVTSDCNILPTNTQAIDFSDRLARIFLITGSSPAQITKLKVCSAGGP